MSYNNYNIATFVNKSGLPINVETWQQTTIGSETLISMLVQPEENITLPSRNGEWYLQTLLNKEDADKWIEAGIKPGYLIGKFRNQPCIKGEYSWMEYEDSPFEIIYDPENLTATFIKK